MGKTNLNHITRLFLIMACWGCLLIEPLSAQPQTLNELMSQARQLGIEQSSLEELRGRAQGRGIGDQELSSFINTAVILAGKQLPSDHIIQKALEGLSKGVPADRIVQVLNTIQQATEQSAEVVEPWINSPGVQQMVDRFGNQTVHEFRNELIKSSAKAVAQNVPAGVIGEVLSDISDEAVISETNPQNIVSAIGVMPDLPITASEPAVSRSFIVRALKGGFGAADFQKLPMALNVAQMRSQIPASGVLQGVANQLQGGIPAAQILQNLFEGNVGGGPPGNVPKGLGNSNNRGNSQGQGNN